MSLELKRRDAGYRHREGDIHVLERSSQHINLLQVRRLRQLRPDQIAAFDFLFQLQLEFSLKRFYAPLPDRLQNIQCRPAGLQFQNLGRFHMALMSLLVR